MNPPSAEESLAPPPAKRCKDVMSTAPTAMSRAKTPNRRFSVTPEMHPAPCWKPGSAEKVDVYTSTDDRVQTSDKVVQWPESEGNIKERAWKVPPTPSRTNGRPAPTCTVSLLQYLINMLMRNEMNKAKKMVVERILSHALEIICLLTGEVSILYQLMNVDKKKMTEKVLTQTLEIISMVTGEEYTIVKKNSPHSSIHQLTGEVPMKCDDVAAYFSMDEWKCIEGHRDLFKDVMMEGCQRPMTMGIPENKNTEVCGERRRTKSIGKVEGGERAKMDIQQVEVKLESSKDLHGGNLDTVYVIEDGEEEKMPMDILQMEIKSEPSEGSCDESLGSGRIGQKEELDEGEKNVQQGVYKSEPCVGLHIEKTVSSSAGEEEDDEIHPNDILHVKIKQEPSEVNMLPRFQIPSIEDRVHFGEEQCNLNTLRKTISDITTIRNFLTELREDRPIQNIPHHDLDLLLSRFIIVARRRDGRQYEPHTLRCMIGSVDRFLKNHKYPHTITYGNSRDFPLTRESLKNKQRFLKKEKKNNAPKRSEVLTDEDIQHLYSSGILSMENPASLLNLVFFNNGIHFGLRTKEQYDLQWGDIVLSIDAAGNQYLEYNEREMKIRSGLNVTNARQVKYRMYATPNNPGRDPIIPYIKYAESRPRSMMAPDSPFYLAPNLNYRPVQSLWFHSMKIGIHKMRRMMTQLKIDTSLPLNKKIMGSPTRKTAIQKLVESRLFPTKVEQVSGHKSHRGFNNFCSITQRRQHEINAILQMTSAASPLDVQTNKSYRYPSTSHS